MTTTSSNLVVSRWSRFAHRLEAAEFIFGAIFWFALPLGILALTAVGLLVMWSNTTRHETTLILTVIWLSVLVPAEWSVMRFFNRRLDHTPIPAPAAFALEQPAYRRLVRPVVAVWWVLHFCVAVVGTQWLISYYLQSMEGRSMSGTAGWVTIVCVTVASTAASHFFLVLATASLVRRPSIVERVWTARHAIEVVIAAAVLTGWISFDIRR